MDGFILYRSHAKGQSTDRNFVDVLDQNGKLQRRIRLQAKGELEGLFILNGSLYGIIFVDSSHRVGSTYVMRIRSGARGNSFACNELGFIYLKGEFTAVDRRKARDWFQRSAQSGNQVGVWMIRHWQGSTILPHIRKDIQCTRDIRGGLRMLEFNLQRNYEKTRNLREAEILQEEIAKRGIQI